MPKKPVKGKKSTNELEKEFLRQLKTIEKNEVKTQRKGPTKNVKTSNTHKVTRIDRSGRKNIPEKTNVSRSDKKRVSSEPVRKGKTGSTKRIAGNVEISRTKRTDQKIHITFKNVRSVKNKIGLLNGPGVDKVLTQQFKRKGGEPPLGMVVTVTDKNGVSASDLAPDTMVINKKNAKEFAERFIKSLQDGNTRFRERNQNRTRAKKGYRSDGVNYKTGEGGGDENGTTGYDKYNPENIQTISIKFIYAKN